MIYHDDYYKWLDELENTAKKKTYVDKCCCGAHKTRNPNIHAEYCDCFRKGKFYTDSSRRKGND